MKLICLWLLLAIGSRTSDSFSVLGLFPHPAISHFRAFQPLLRELANRGHEVFVVSHFPNEDNATTAANYRDFVLDQSQVLTEAFTVDEVYSPRSMMTYYDEFYSLAEWGGEACEKLLSSEHIDVLLQLSRDRKFDVLITEYFNTDCALGLAYKLNISTFIGMSSCALMPWHYDRVGLPDIPSYIPSEFVGFTSSMSFFERFTNWMVVKLTKIGYRMAQMEDNERLRKRFGAGIPDLRDLADNTSLIFVNQHFSFAGPRPLPANVVEIGGIHITKSRKSLPDDLQQLLDNANNGVIYVSWGSIINSQGMSLSKKQEIVGAFKRLPQTVLWKWQNDSLTATAKNIHIRSWLPQIDILCHPNVKVFMSHGGLMGTSEGVYCQKPTIVTPIYGDQYLNAAALEERGMGITLHYNQLTEDRIVDAIQRILDPSYKRRAIEISHSYRNRLSDPLETAVFWVEYVAENSGNLLQSRAAVKLNSLNYHSLDVILVLLCSIAATISLVIKAIRRLLKNIESAMKGEDLLVRENATTNKKLN